MPHRRARRRTGRLPIVAATAALIASASGAISQQASLLPTPPAADALPGLPTGNLLAMPEGVRVSVGAMGVMLPKYEGSKSYQFTALPVFQFRPLVADGGLGAPSSFDARNLDDLSVAVIKHSGFEFGPLAGWRLGRAEKDSPRLVGLGDIDGGLVAGAYAKYDFGPAFVRASFHQHVTGSDTGSLVRLALGTRYALHPAVVLKADATVDFASDDYMAAYFGVTAAQSARSGLRAFDAGAGLKSVGGTLGTEYALTEDWKLLATVGYTRLLGDAANSPIIETADRYEARLGASRSFDWRLR